LFFSQSQCNINDFGHSFVHEIVGWTSPTYAYAHWINVNIELSFLVIIQGFIGSTEFRPAEYLEGPKLASGGFHVLKTAEPPVEILAQEDAGSIVSSCEMKLANTGLGNSYPIGANDVQPFREGEKYFVAPAACTACDAVPRFYVSPRNRFHAIIIRWNLSFIFLVDLFYKHVLGILGSKRIGRL